MSASGTQSNPFHSEAGGGEESRGVEAGEQLNSGTQNPERTVLFAAAVRERADLRAEVEAQAEALLKPIKSLKMSDVGENFPESAETQKILVQEFRSERMLEKMQILRQTKINPDTWQVSDEQGVGRVLRDLNKLGFPLNDPYYTKLFAILLKGKETARNAGRSGADLALYEAPESGDNFNRLFQVDKRFADAFTVFLQLKGEIKAYREKHIQDAIRANEGGVVTKYTNTFIEASKANVGKFLDAVKSGDWATASVFGIGALMLYKAFKPLIGSALGAGENGGMLGWAKYGLILGGAALATNAFLKNAGMRGFDFGKFGLAPEISDTSFHSMSVLAGEYGLEVDSEFLLQKTGELKVGELYREFMKSGNTGFIKLEEFPAAFSDLISDKGRLGSMTDAQWQAGIDNGFYALKPLSIGEQNYLNASKKLYNTVLLLQRAYNDHLKQKQNGMSFEEFLNGPGTKNSTVQDLAYLIGVYHIPAKEPSLSLNSSQENFKTRFNAVFGNISLMTENHPDPRLEEVENGKAVYKVLMRGGYPTYFRNISEDEYRVFLADDYPPNSDQNYVTFNLASDATSLTVATEILNDKIDSVVRKVFERLERNGFNNPTYRDGKWEVTVVPRHVPEESGVASKFTLNFKETVDVSGKRRVLFDLLDESGGLEQSVDGLAVIQNSPEEMYLLRLCAQDNLNFLTLLKSAGKLSVDLPQASESQEFTLKIAEVDNFEMKFQAGNYVFTEPDKFYESEKLHWALAKVAMQKFEPRLLELKKKIDKVSFGRSSDFLAAVGWKENPLPELAKAYLDVFQARMSAELADQVKSLLATQTTAQSMKLTSAKIFANNHGIWIDRILEIENTLAVRDITPEYFKSQVLDKLLLLDKKGGEYRNFANQLEFELLNAESNKQTPSLIAEKMQKFLALTADLDDKSLDDLKYPASASVNPTDNEKYLKLRYFDYVRGGINGGGACEAWDAWKNKNLNTWFTPIDPLDADGPVEFDTLDVKNSNGLGSLFFVRFDLLIEKFIRENENNINVEAITRYESDFVVVVEDSKNPQVANLNLSRLPQHLLDGVRNANKRSLQAKIIDQYIQEEIINKEFQKPQYWNTLPATAVNTFNRFISWGGSFF